MFTLSKLRSSVVIPPIQHVPCFDDLPNEIIKLIIQHLDIDDRLRIRQVNSILRQLSLTRIAAISIGSSEGFLWFPIEIHLIDFEDKKNCQLFKFELKTKHGKMKKCES